MLLLIVTMAAHTLKRVQVIPTSLENAWQFFSNPANLALITPGNMGFKVISQHHGDSIYAGQLIEYTIKPFLGIPFYWMTEITQVKQREYFIDEQRHGPYKLWHHQHYFKEVPGGVEMTDIVHYKIPMWWIGRLAHSIWVKKKLETIFNYRRKKVEEIFASLKS